MQPDDITNPDYLERFWAKVRMGDGCWTWVGASLYGRNGARTYGRIQLRRGQPIRAHRFAWAIANGRMPGTEAVCHSCDNPQCVRPSHLWLGSQIQNLADMRAKGRANLSGLRNQA